MPTVGLSKFAYYTSSVSYSTSQSFRSAHVRTVKQGRFVSFASCICHKRWTRACSKIPTTASASLHIRITKLSTNHFSLVITPRTIADSSPVAIYVHLYMACSFSVRGACQSNFWDIYKKDTKQHLINIDPRASYVSVLSPVRDGLVCLSIDVI